MKSFEKFIILFLVFALAFAAVSCSYEPETLKEEVVIDGVRVTEEQWKKAFGENIAKGKGRTENINKFGFDSVTLTFECLGGIGDDGIRYGDKSLGKEVKLFIGDGWMYVQDVFSEIYSGQGTKWISRVISDGNVVVDEIDDRGSSTAPLEAVFNYRDKQEMSINNNEVVFSLKDNYSDEAFIEEEGCYKFVFKSGDQSLVADTPTEDGSYFEYKVRFDSRGLMTFLSEECYQIAEGTKYSYKTGDEDGFILKYSFTDYNLTQKPADSRLFP